MPEDNVFINIKWKTNPIQAYFRYNTLGSPTFIDKKLEIGDEINLRIGEDQLCIGTDYERGVWLTCVGNQLRQFVAKMVHMHPNLENLLPDKLIDQIEFLRERGVPIPEKKERFVSSRYLQCTLCITTEYFTCRMTCRGDICDPTSPRAKALCDPPNTSVYLTHVGGELKVGVSLGLPRRWVEQASDISAQVAIAPGLIARRIEHRAAEELSLKLHVRNQTKMQNLGALDIGQARLDLSNAIELIKPIIKEELLTSPGEIVEEPPIQSFVEYYGLNEFDTQPQVIDVVPGAEFGGEIVSIKGSIIVVKQDIYYYTMDFKRLQSITFSFLDKPAAVKKQGNLDEWFLN